MLPTLHIFVGILATTCLSKFATGDGSVSNMVHRSDSELPGCLARFADYPPGAGKFGFPRCLIEKPFQANPSFWAKGIDFSCASPWNDSYARFRAGTAISRRHIIFAKHFPLTVGTRIAFVGESGDVSHYSIKAIKAPGKTDIMIGLLDYELTPDVHPAKVLPADYEKWLMPGSRWPVITFNQHEQAYLSEVSCSTNNEFGTLRLWTEKPTDRAWQKLGGEVMSGDSGNPAFMIFRKQAILLYCIFGGGVGHGPMIHEYRHEIQQAMDALAPGYKLEEFNFATSP